MLTKKSLGCVFVLFCFLFQGGFAAIEKNFKLKKSSSSTEQQQNNNLNGKTKLLIENQVVDNYPKIRIYDGNETPYKDLKHGSKDIFFFDNEEILVRVFKDYHHPDDEGKSETFHLSKDCHIDDLNPRYEARLADDHGKEVCFIFLK